MEGGSANDARPSLLERLGAAAAGIGQAGPRSPAARAALQWGLAALIFAFLLLFVVRQWNQLPDFDWRFEPWWLALSALAIFAWYSLQAELWRLIVRALEGGSLDPASSRSAWGKSLLARYVPTNALMVVGRVVLAERLGVPGRVCLASIAYELGLALCTAVMVGAYFVIELPSLEEHPVRFGVLALVPLALVLLHPRVFGPLANFALRKLGREPLPRTLRFGQVLAFAVAYVLAWALIGLGVFAFASALHPVSGADLTYVAASYPVAFCVAVLTFIVPSGLGTRDAALATAMAAVLPGAVATAIAVAFRLFQTLVELVFVGLAVLRGRSRS